MFQRNSHQRRTVDCSIDNGDSETLHRTYPQRCKKSSFSTSLSCWNEADECDFQQDTGDLEIGFDQSEEPNSRYMSRSSTSSSSSVESHSHCIGGLSNRPQLTLMRNSDSWRNNCHSTPAKPAATVDRSQFRYRPILPTDRQQIQQLHEKWFPVSYQDEFYDELVYGRMYGTNEPLYTLLVVADHPTNASDEETIVACVVGSFVRTHTLPVRTQNLLINCPKTHPRLFYIMTLGCRREYRGYGLGTFLIQQCMEQVLDDQRCGALYLHVLVHNQTAVHMYEKLGFYRVEEIPGYYTIDDQPQNCYLYAQYHHRNRGHRTILRSVTAAMSTFWLRYIVPTAGLMDWWKTSTITMSLSAFPSLTSSRMNCDSTNTGIR